MTARFDPANRQHEQRTVRANVRADEGVEGRITARVLTYGTIDSYDTSFRKGVFTASMQERMPRIAWNHDWGDIIGVWTGYSEDADGLTLVGQLDDFDAVPRAKQAWAQLKSGSIDQFSVGFWPEEASESEVEGRSVLTFTRGTLDEASLVMVGAVPGTKVLALRTLQRDALDVLAAVHNVDVETVAAIEAALLKATDDEDVLDDDVAVAEEEVAADEAADEHAQALDWTVEDVQAWALLADSGDEDAALALSHIADEYGEDSDEWATWTEFVSDVLVEEVWSDDAAAAVASLDTLSEDVASESVEGDTAAADAAAVELDSVDAEAIAALSVLDGLL